MKDHNLDPKSSNDNNPFGAVIAALTGQELFPRPRLKTAVNTWCKTDVIEINKVVQQTVVAEKTPPGKTVAVWNRVAKQLFNLLKPEEKKYWEKKAKENHEAALAEWKASRDKKIGTSPEARQKCVPMASFLLRMLISCFFSGVLKGWFALGSPLSRPWPSLPDSRLA